MSRCARIKNHPDEPGFFHVVCRTVGKAFLFEDEAEKRRLLLWLDKAVEFCGVDLQAWCIMSNHIHLLLKVPPRQEVSDAELDRRMRVLYLPHRYNSLMAQWESWRKQDKSEIRIEAAKAKLRRRMYDISWFMKTFKQAVAQDYNARHEHSGSIWGGGRFKSVYLEGTRHVLLAVAAYIHLNPVRAKIVSSAERYLWSSWGEACAHPCRSRDGLLRLYDGITPKKSVAWPFLQEQLEDIQARVTSQRRALEAFATTVSTPQLPPAAEKCQNYLAGHHPPSKPTTSVPIVQKLAARVPALSSSRVLGSNAFVEKYMRPLDARRSPQRSHQHLLAVGSYGNTILSTLGNRSLGRSCVAYTRALTSGANP